MVCSGLCPRTCTNEVLQFCERSINTDANHLKILPSALFLFFNRASQIEAFRWCNCSLGPQAQSYRSHVNCGIPSSQAIMFERVFALARSERVLTPGYSWCTESQTAQTLCSDPLHGSSPRHPAPTQREMLTPSQRNTGSRLCGVPQSFFPPGVVRGGGTVSHRSSGVRVMLTHLRPFGLRGHDGAVGMPHGLIPPRAHGRPGDKSIQATAPGNTSFFPGKK